MNKESLKKLFAPLNQWNKKKKKQDNLIFFYANLGFRDNVRALYEFLVAQHYNEKYEIVCASDDYMRWKDTAPRHVKFVSSKAGIPYFLKCKYAFYCYGKYPIKPAKDQIVVNLWHGMPLKCIGNMEPGKENIDYNYFTYVLATSDFFAKIMEKSFSCTEEQVLINGQPRTDALFQKNEDLDKRLRVNCKKLVLWMPTFRNEKPLEEKEKNDWPVPLLSLEEGKKLGAFCKAHDIQLLIKLHPLQYCGTLVKMEGITLLTHEQFEHMGIGLYDYLRNADALITDYSSVYFDYLLLDRPIAFTVDDFDEYAGSRGFVFEHPQEYMPGDTITEYEELLGFLQKLAAGEDEYKEKRRAVNVLVNKYQDGNACKRLCNMLFSAQ